ncbi:MAG: DUF4465 domain-containing protein [Bacteroidia bacterium]|nr:DUF4465 domain-containing protein [Bacteroidia bacterium]
MKKTLLTFAAFLMIAGAGAQTVSDFENLSLAANSYWNGSADANAKGFTDGHAFFTNSYDTSFGGFWAGGFAYTNKKDSTNGTYTNLYSAITAQGYNGSSNYAIGQQDAVIRLTGNARGRVANGIYVTNATYPYKSMKNGDSFAKKFGGTTGNDPDFFVMHFIGWLNGVKKADTVKFYLADFRSAVNAQDYIINQWTWVDLSSLGNIDSIQINLNSTDTGAFGINTPLFYAVDNFTTRDEFATLVPSFGNSNSIQAFPNPFENVLNLTNESDNETLVNIIGSNGQLVTTCKVKAKETFQLITDEWAKGIYFVQVVSGDAVSILKLVK